MGHKILKVQKRRSQNTVKDLPDIHGPYSKENGAP